MLTIAYHNFFTVLRLGHYSLLYVVDIRTELLSDVSAYQVAFDLK